MSPSLPSITQGRERRRGRVQALHRAVRDTVGNHRRRRQRAAPVLPPRRRPDVHRRQEQALPRAHIAGRPASRSANDGRMRNEPEWGLGLFRMDV